MDPLSPARRYFLPVGRRSHVISRSRGFCRCTHGPPATWSCILICPILSPHPHFPFSHTPINIAPFSPFPLTAPRPGQRALLCSWRRRPRNGRCLWGLGPLRLHLLGSPLLPPLRSISRSFVLLPSDGGFWGAAGSSGVALLLTSTSTRPSFFLGDLPLSRRVDPLRVCWTPDCL